MSGLTMAGDLSGALFELVADVTMLRWPSPRFRDDPVGFARNVLSVDPWAAQREVLESVRDNARTTWKSGHRVSKSNTGGIVSCWFYGSFDDARVIMSAPTARQVDGILWRETQKLVRQSGICLECRRAGKLDQSPCPHSAKLDGKLGKRAATGLQAGDFRDDGATDEEQRIADETQRILGDIPISATCVQAPVFVGHSLVLNVELGRAMPIEELREVLRETTGVVVVDNREEETFVTPIETVGEWATYVSRIREDASVPNGVAMWITGDNLRKAAALNAVMTAELLARSGAFARKVTE